MDVDGNEVICLHCCLSLIMRIFPSIFSDSIDVLAEAITAIFLETALSEETPQTDRVGMHDTLSVFTSDYMDIYTV